MNKSKATTALKSLLVSGCALFVWGMTPVFLASTLTSCEKLEELLGGDDEGDDDGDGSSSGNLNGVGTTDGAAPYFNLETTRIEVPAVRGRGRHTGKMPDQHHKHALCAGEIQEIQ